MNLFGDSTASSGLQGPVVLEPLPDTERGVLKNWKVIMWTYLVDESTKAVKVIVGTIVWASTLVIIAYVASWANWFLGQFLLGIIDEVAAKTLNIIITIGTVSLVVIYTLDGIFRAWREVFENSRQRTK